jgi:hypothetical protein
MREELESKIIAVLNEANENLNSKDFSMLAEYTIDTIDEYSKIKRRNEQEERKD